jgi:hypothetical protein
VTELEDAGDYLSKALQPLRSEFWIFIMQPNRYGRLLKLTVKLFPVAHPDNGSSACGINCGRVMGITS